MWLIKEDIFEILSNLFVDLGGTAEKLIVNFDRFNQGARVF